MDNSEDLPLSANHDQFEVDHYSIELHCDMRRRVFSGGVTLQVSRGSKWAGQSVMVLDCSDIDVESVQMISRFQHFMDLLQKPYFRRDNLVYKNFRNYTNMI